jgi:O-antigen ligase
MQRLLLIGLVASALVLLAGAPPWTTLPLTALALTAALVHPPRTFALPAADRILDLSLIAACALIVLQLIPLPRGIRDALSPQAHEVASAILLDRRFAETRFAPLSVDPAATWHALAAVVVSTLAFWTTRAVLAATSLRWLVRAIVIIGGVLALTALVFRAIDPTRLFATWEPATAAARPFGPFVNRNHFAGWMVVVMPVGVGYLLAHLRTHLRQDALSPRELTLALTRSWAAPVALSVMVMAMALFATLSRSAFAGMLVAVTVTWTLGHRRLAGSGMMRRLVVVAAGAAVLALAVIDVDALATRMANTLVDRPVDRLVIWRETLRLITAFPVFGVGAGAYGTGMLVYQQTQVRMPHQQEWVHFNQAHSHYLQVAAEGGALLVIVLIAGLAGLAWAASRAMRADQSAIALVRVGAAAGLAGMATQSLWETSLTVPANAIIAAVAAGLLLHSPRIGTRLQRHSSRRFAAVRSSHRPETPRR